MDDTVKSSSAIVNLFHFVFPCTMNVLRFPFSHEALTDIAYISNDNR